MYNYYVKLADARLAIMDYIGEQTDCKLVRDGAEGAMNALDYLTPADVVPRSEVDDLKRYIILNEDIAIKCKQENGEQNEEYWKGKISAFRQILAYIDAELKKKYTEGE